MYSAPGTPPRQAVERTGPYLEATTALADGRSGSTDSGPGVPRQTVVGALERPWDTVTAPVLDALGRTAALPGPPENWPSL
ncbi:hypothetical protein GCM10010300_86270 [Streptomyces olivaceoviridis]|uniref:hypothetical protein n=1 Tax=Streptomyces olivaceoviridis TaxID=1921 RepID=UPI00167327BB|nr:hypothetical protein [Streptomyces olivaceoviridis]GGZ30273.1 hypothetical protein GCM10010300_86270 [Streptomyces olivaceoviridis]